MAFPGSTEELSAILKAAADFGVTPRILGAGLAGILLAAAGCAVQLLFRNPLSSPHVLGSVNASALGAVASGAEASGAEGSRVSGWAESGAGAASVITSFGGGGKWCPRWSQGRARSRRSRNGAGTDPQGRRSDRVSVYGCDPRFRQALRGDIAHPARYAEQSALLRALSVSRILPGISSPPTAPIRRISRAAHPSRRRAPLGAHRTDRHPHRLDRPPP